MQIEYEISEQDFVDGLQLALRNLPGLASRLFFRILPFWGVLVFLGIAWPIFQKGFSWKLETLLPFSLALLALLSPWLVKRSYKKVYRKNPAFKGRRTVAFDDARMNITGPDFSSQIGWARFTSFAEGDKAFVVYQNQNVSQFIPKRELTPDQITELRETLTRNIGQKKSTAG